MALFGKKRPVQAPDMSVAKAVLTPAVATMLADGKADQSELYQLENVVSFSPIFFQYKNDQIKSMITEIIDMFNTRGGIGALEDAAKALSPSLRETALCFAMRIAVADGYLDENEKNALAATAATMNISPEVFNKVFEVVAMMQRPAAA